MRRLAMMMLCGVIPCMVLMAQEGDINNKNLDAFPPVPMASISVFIMKISPELAADWGLDGGPAAKPESTPLKKDIPRLLGPEDARKVISALRKAKGTDILASNSIVVASGNEAFGAEVKEVAFPESYESEEIYFNHDAGEDEGDDDDEDDDEDDDDDDDDDEEKRPKRQVPGKPFVMGDEPTIWDFGPIMGEPRRDIGMILTAVPQVAADGHFISLDLHPKLTVDKKAKPTFFMFSTFEVRTQVIIPNGCTLIAYNGFPAPRGDFAEYKQDASTDRRPYVMFITAKIIEQPKGSTRK